MDARAIVASFTTGGLGAGLMQFVMQVDFCFDSGGAVREEVTAQWNITDNLATISSKCATAVRAYATGKGWTVPANHLLMPSFSKA